MTKVAQAVSTFNEGFSCSQAILTAYGIDFGLDRNTALKISSAFGGGMARMGETCGAVTGALMVIGLRYGSTNAEDKNAKEITYEKVNEFVKNFNGRNNTIICKDLLGFDLSTPEGKKAVSEKDLVKTKCPKFVQDAAEILEQLL
jgi:C_GCAxxG_C_C family probable redox protein